MGNIKRRSKTHPDWEVIPDNNDMKFRTWKWNGSKAKQCVFCGCKTMARFCDIKCKDKYYAISKTGPE